MCNQQGDIQSAAQKAAWDAHLKMEAEARAMRKRLSETNGDQASAKPAVSQAVRAMALEFAVRTVPIPENSFSYAHEEILRAARAYEAYIIGA